MNDRAISGVLEKYDMEVMRTMKGRGTIVCQSQEGYRVLKEYKGRTDKLELLDKMQKSMEGSIRTDKLIRNKEGELFCKDTDGVVYILKEHIEGRECSYRSEEDIRQAFAVILNGEKQMLANITIYPQEYFCPYNRATEELNITENTYSIHYFNGAWINDNKKRIISKRKKIIRKYGKNVGYIYYGLALIKNEGVQQFWKELQVMKRKNR